MATTPNLGYGKQSEVQIDVVNQWMRSTPWYQQQMRAWGQDPGHPTLTKAQSAQILRQAQANGVVVDEGDMEVDDHGNFNPKGHKLRNTLVVAGIAGAAIATMGAAGAFGGAAAAGSGAGGAGTGGTLASTGALSASALPAGAAASGAVPAALAAGSTGAGASTALGAAAAAAGTKGLSYADILKYGAPVAGNLVGGIIQANAEGKASAAQQAYLEEALAYEKEKDAYERTRCKRRRARGTSAVQRLSGPDRAVHRERDQ
jgi:hypothetical protein